MAYRQRASWFSLLTVTVGGIFAVTAKTQMISLVLPVIIILLWWPLGTPSLTEHRSFGVRLVDLAWHRGPGVVLAAVMALSAITYQNAQPKRFEELNTYGAVFSEILTHSQNPEADLRAIGAPISLAGAAGSHILSSNSAARMKDYREFRENVSTGDIARFWLTHPGRTVGTIGRGFEQMAKLRPNYLYSYPPSVNKEPRKENRVPIANILFAPARAWPWVIPFGWVIVGFSGIMIGRRALSPTARTYGALCLILLVSALSQMLVAVLGDGTDVTRHLLETNFITLLMLPAVIAAWVTFGSEVEDK
jgi:hypothetical protein